MRRLAALLLIAASAWLVWRTVSRTTLAGGELVDELAEYVVDPNFIVPVLGGVFGIAGGLIALLGGPGGAAIGMIGGVMSAGYLLYTGRSFAFESFRIWENEPIVGFVILGLAGIVALAGRD